MLRFGDLFDVAGLSRRDEAACDAVPAHWRENVQSICDWLAHQIERAKDAGWCWYVSIKPAEVQTAHRPDGGPGCVLVPGDAWDVLFVFRRPKHAKPPKLRVILSPREVLPTGAPPGHGDLDTPDPNKLPGEFRMDAGSAVDQLRRLLLWAEGEQRPWHAAIRAAKADEVHQRLPSPVVADDVWDATWRPGGRLSDGSKVVVFRISAPQRAPADVGLKYAVLE